MAINMTMQLGRPVEKAMDDNTMLACVFGYGVEVK